MTDVESKIIVQVANKLGVGEHGDVIRKSSEINKMLKRKISAPVAGVNEYAKAVICIDLATTILGYAIDMDDALKLSGMKKTNYKNVKSTYEKFLELNSPKTVSELTVELGLSQIKDLASRHLDRYSASIQSTVGEVDLRHPQYVAMAVCQACKDRKIKVPQAKLLAFSRLKLAQWKLLEKSWLERVQMEVQPAVILNDETSSSNATEDKTQNVINGENNEPPFEDYLVWKRRMLERAYAELKKTATVSS